MKRFVAVAVLAVSLTGCAGWGTFYTCMKDQAPKDAVPVLVAVASIASAPTGYVADLLALGKQVGVGLVDCAVQGLIADTKNANLKTMLSHLDEYLKARMAMGVDPVCKPALASL